MPSLRFHGAEGFAALRDEWDALAARTPSPFLTHAWLAAWWTAFGAGEPVAAALHGDRDELLAAALLRRRRDGGLAATVNDHSGDWGAVAVDDGARAALWRALAARRGPTLTLARLRGDEEWATASAAARAAGRRVHVQPEQASPYLRMPGSFDDLLAARSANLRSQLRRRTRALERAGALELRTTTSGPRLDADFDAFVAVEGSGWKDRAGTSIARDAPAARLYRAFATAAAERGWLRLHLLELDGEVLAADLGCVIGDQAFLIKTGFATGHAERSPGLVLRGAVIRHLVDEGVRGYDLLGGPDAYKLRWTDELRPRASVRGFRGLAGAGPALWWRVARPAAVRARARLRDARGQGRTAPAPAAPAAA